MNEQIEDRIARQKQYLRLVMEAGKKIAEELGLPPRLVLITWDDPRPSGTTVPISLMQLCKSGTTDEELVAIIEATRRMFDIVPIEDGQPFDDDGYLRTGSRERNRKSTKEEDHGHEADS